MTVDQKHKLKKDAKTLVDISTMLEHDGRFKVLPSILKDIANDIQISLARKAVERGDEK